MKRLPRLFVCSAAATLVSCTSVPPSRDVLPLMTSKTDQKIGLRSWEEGGAIVRQGRPEKEAAAIRIETYLELCDSTCTLPGLFGDEEHFARADGQISRITGLNGSLTPETVSYFEAANDFANRFNRAVFARFHSAQK